MSNDTIKFDLNDKQKWVDHVKEMNIYKSKLTICRFFLLAAYHNTIQDPVQKGLITRDNATPVGSRQFLSYDFWINDAYKSIEHIAPQNGRENLDYSNTDQKVINTVGNLIIIPSNLNITISNEKWSIKRNLFAAMSSSQASQRRTFLEKAESEGFQSTQFRRNIISSDESSEILQGISKFENWNSSNIEKRSERICSLAWDKLVVWLQPTD